MTDKLYNLMDSYLSKDIPDIQKQYFFGYSESSITLNTPWLALVSTSRKPIATRQLHTQ